MHQGRDVYTGRELQSMQLEHASELLIALCVTDRTQYVSIFVAWLSASKCSIVLLTDRNKEGEFMFILL